MKSSCRDRIFLFGLLFSFCLVSGGTPAFAQTLIETQELYFGTIVVANTGSNHDLVLQPNGGYISDPAIYVMDTPVVGEYQLVGGTPTANYTISFDSGIVLQGSGTDFTLDDFTAMPAALMTDASGDVSFSVGATLTAVSGGSYTDGTYTGQLDITVTLDN